MKKDCKVKSHKRKGKMVKSHSRTITTADKKVKSVMSAEECKAKYDAMVAKFGADSPQAKKLAMKMENMEIVDKDYKVKKHSRGSYMRKGIEEDVLTKEAKKKKSSMHEKMAKLRAMRKKK